MDFIKKLLQAEHCDGEWENKALEICERELGPSKFQKRFNKSEKFQKAGIGSKTRLSIDEGKIKKAVTKDLQFLRHYNAVGAVGYAKVLEDPRIPENDFFIPGKRFRIRFRHSNLRCDDDAAVCQREAAIKFADQTEDGPLDLIFFTGRTALARNSKSFLDIVKLKKRDDIKNICFKDPHVYFALVDCMRRAPTSFAEMHYYSQVPYKFIPRDEKPRIARFRLIPSDGSGDSGLLSLADQERVWETARSANEGRSKGYLRTEFLKRIEVEPVLYMIQIQIRTLEDETDESLWNPQSIWPTEQHPWINIVEIRLTTPLTCSALKRTYFNITDKPLCLKFPPPTSIHDPRSYQRMCCTMYTTMEIKRMGHPNFQLEGGDTLRASGCSHERVTHVVGLATGPRKDSQAKVDVFIALTGTHGRSTPRRLDDKWENPPVRVRPEEGQLEYFTIETEPIGDILTVTIAVRHRHLTDDWYLRYVTIADTGMTYTRVFPCHSVVLSKMNLRPGDVSLPHQECHEVLRQERLLELRDRQQDYQWLKIEGLPSQIKGRTIKDLPANEQLRAEKFATVIWDIDTSLAEVIKPMINSAQTYQNGKVRHSVSQDDSVTVVQAQRPKLQRRLSVPAKSLNKGCVQIKNLHGASTSNHISVTTAPNGAGAATKLSATGRPRNPVARARWAKIRLAINFISKVRLPDGPQGEMCRLCQDDRDYGRLFLMGANPVVLKRCDKVPDKFPVLESVVKPLMERKMTLDQECQAGHVYIADYEVLDGVPCIHQDADHRYLTAPMCMFYVRKTGDMTPLAIQLEQTPGPGNPIWTPRDPGEDWLMAKLWVRCADFHHQLLVSHIAKCHYVLEPFVIAMMRMISTSHPVYKLLKPHFRYTLPMNTLLRMNVTRKGGALDKWTSLGSEGFRAVARKYFKTFTFDQLSLPKDLEMRGVDDSNKLPQYFYRDDGLKLWNSISTYCRNMMGLFYSTDDDVKEDPELQQWISDLDQNGFPTVKAHIDIGLPTHLTTLDQLNDILTKIVFTATVQETATHAEALDLYAFLPLVPGMMRHPPPNKKNIVGRDLLVKTLPDQSPESYYGSLAYVLATCKADKNPLGARLEVYFVEDEAQQVRQAFCEDLKHVSRSIEARNLAMPYKYEQLLPDRIPNSVEPVPFFPLTEAEVMDDFRYLDGRGMAGMPANPAVPLMTLPICMQFAKSMGGNSFIGRRLSVNMFSKAMGGVNVDRVNVPMNAIDRKKMDIGRYKMNMQMNMQMNNALMMY